MNNDKTLVLRLPEREHRKISDVAKSKKITMSEVVRRLIKVGLDEKRG